MFFLADIKTVKIQLMISKDSGHDKIVLEKF